MFKGRRVGTLTTGIVLIVFGLLFLFRIPFPQIRVDFILSLWPAILIFLGIEVLLHYMFAREEQMKYDGGAIFLMIVLALFTMTMAGAEFILNNMSEFSGLFY